MHPYVLIPLLSLVSAGVLASAIAARERDRRANRLASLLVLCAGLWSLFEFLFGTASDAALALRYLRWTALGSLLVCPLVLHLLVASPEVGLQRFRRLLPFSYAAALLSTLGTVSTDWVVAGVERTSWGWAALPGPALPAVYALVASCPLAAVVVWFLRGRGRLPRGSSSAGAELAGLFCFVTSTTTDFLLPLLGIPFPRLGSACLVAWGGVIWWTFYRPREPRLAPWKFAREILKILPDGVALVRLNGRIPATNERFAQLVEQPALALMGMPIGELLSAVDEPQTGAEAERECELVSASGHRIPVSVSRSPLADEEGHVIGHVLVVRDLREVVSLRSRLVASGRLVAVGQLAAGMAHEINNPVAYVRSNLGLLEQHWEEVAAALEKEPCGPLVQAGLDEGPQLLEETSEGVDRIAAIVREVSGFSRGGGVETDSADLVELLDAAVRVAAPQLAQTAIERCYAELPRVPCVPQELMQVFLNLLLNASQSMEGAGTIRLATRLEGDEALVEVADDGAGIEPGIEAQIFEPFFSTRPSGKGTGLGLSISQQIISNLGGSIGVESDPGRGTTFRIRLPVKRQTACVAGERA
jgi:signal transduction histidine kinase